MNIDFMEDYLPQVDRHDKAGQMYRSAMKSVAAGIAGLLLLIMRFLKYLFNQ